MWGRADTEEAVRPQARAGAHQAAPRGSERPFSSMQTPKTRILCCTRNTWSRRCRLRRPERHGRIGCALLMRSTVISSRWKRLNSRTEPFRRRMPSPALGYRNVESCVPLECRCNRCSTKEARRAARAAIFRRKYVQVLLPPDELVAIDEFRFRAGVILVVTLAPARLASKSRI